MVHPPRRRRASLSSLNQPYHHGDLRRAVQEEALALIEEQGHMSFTLREVARRIGVSHAAPYRHFADKRALMTELAVSGMQALAKDVRSALDAAGSDLRARFLAAGFAYVRFALEHPASFGVMYSGEVDSADPRVSAAKAESLGILLGFVEEAQRSGVFPAGDPMDLARPIWAMHHGLASLAAADAFERDPSELRGIVDGAHTRLLDGLMQAAPAGPRGAPGSGRGARGTRR